MGWDHPRLRGEYEAHAANQGRQIGSPPLARGIHVLKLEMEDGIRITPACAGNTSSGVLFPGVWWDHPRLRGEYNGLTTIFRNIVGSPPLARGIQKYRHIGVPVHRITPACAGNTVNEVLDRVYD